VLAVAVVVAAFATTSATACATTTFVEIACQVDSRFGALCTVFSDRRQAEVTQRGRADAFPLESNPPSEGVPTLSYGNSVRVRKVRCTSKRKGMRCVHRPTGHGFLAAQGSIRRF